MNNLERLREKLKDAKQKRTAVAPTAGIPISLDLTPFIESVEENLKVFILEQKAEELGEYRKAIKEIVGSEISEQSPDYVAMMKSIDERFDAITEKVADVRNRQEEISKDGMKIAKPAWYKEFSDSKFLNSMGTMLVGIKQVADNVITITKALIRVDLSLHTDPTRAVAVKLVDLDDKFYKARGRGGGSGGGSVRPDGSTQISAGRKTITSAGTAEALVSSTTTAKRVIISALTDNTDVCYVGNSAAKATDNAEVGIPLYASNTIELYVADLKNIYIDARVSGEGVTYYYEN